MVENKNIYKKISVELKPSDWKKIKLGNLTDKKVKWSFTGGPFGSNLKAEHYTESGIRIIQLQNIGDGHFNDSYKIYTSLDKANELLSCNVYPGDIILSKMGDPVARGCFIPDTEVRFLMSSDGIRVVPDNSIVDSYFLLSYINHSIFRNEAIKKSIGSTRQRIGLDDLKSIYVYLPSLAEQRKIADILSTFDTAIKNCKSIMENIKSRNIGLAQQLLSGKMRVKGFEKSQWHLKSVDEVAVFKNGKAHENCIDEDGDYFVVNSKFISTQGKVAKASNENLCPLFKNDITMVMSDIPNGKAFAKCFYIPEDDKYTLNQRICALTARKGTDSKFLYYQMNRNNYYLAFNNGVSQTNLKKDEVLECPLLMPDIEEQIQIVKLIDTANEELNQYQQKLETLQLQKKGLMQQLLTGKTRVKT